MMPARTLLFTAFEPSGDDHAAPLIAGVKREHPDWVIYALGGPKMEKAGAVILERTTENAVMLAAALGKYQWRQRLLRMVRDWLREHAIDGFVPVDSPAANGVFCDLIRERMPGAKIVHCVAPQHWAWASWRVKGLQRRTDHLLCLLPFEPAWFAQHGVPATFVGHPVFEEEPEVVKVEDLPQGAGLKLALLPGSRWSEVTANGPTMIKVVERLRSRHPQLQVCVAAVNQRTHDFFPTDYARVIGRVEDVLAWAEVGLIVSGTAVLQAAARGLPLVAMYNVNWWTWQLLGKWLMVTQTFTLPNLIGENQGWGRLTPELVPHFGQVEPIVAALEPLLREQATRQKQQADFQRMRQVFAGVSFAEKATGTLLAVLGEGGQKRIAISD